jgi:hypothetical protein
MAQRNTTRRTFWGVLATDGAHKPIQLYEMDEWEFYAGLHASGLHDLLLPRCLLLKERDPDGVAMPRAKRHDDKAIAAVAF